jgi:serine/threonine-protein kinase
LDDAFAIQSDVAQQVVTAVGAALSSAEASAIAAVPTQNADAYRMYLEGEGYRRGEWTLENLGMAQQSYEGALALDTTFALAWAALSTVHGTMHWYGYDPSSGRLAEQRRGAETALRLAPDLAEALWAAGWLHYVQFDYREALREYTLALQAFPGSAELWEHVGWAHRRLGEWEQALAAWTRAIALNPRDPGLHGDLGGNTFTALRRYDDAIVAYTRALELDPDNPNARLARANVFRLWRGELDSLRVLLGSDGPTSFSNLGGRDWHRARLALWERRPDTLLAVLGSSGPAIFEVQGFYEPRLLLVGWAHQLRQDRVAATRAFTGALAQLDSALAEMPDDVRLWASRGLTLAALGRQSEAIREAARLAQHPAYATDVYSSESTGEPRALIFAQAGLPDSALAEVQSLLAAPSNVTVPKIRLDPRWDPIRDDPRFQALLVKYANPQPVR